MTTRPHAGVTHHYVLEDDEHVRLGLLSPDNMASFLRAPITRTALKMAQGDTRYSDMEPPYTTEMQEDFSGGRAQRNLADDKTKFYDSQNVDTRIKGQAFLGPQTNLVMLANVGMPEYNPGNVFDVWVANCTISQPLGMSQFPSGYVPYLAQSFTVNARGMAITGGTMLVFAFVEDTIVVTLQADSGGSPSGTPLATDNCAAAVGTNTLSFTFITGNTLTAGATYWIVARHPTGMMRGYGTTGDPYPDGSVKYSSNGTTWSALPSPFADADLRFTLTFSQVKYACSFTFADATAVATTVDETSAADQKVLKVASTTGFTAGDTVTIAMGIVGREEIRVIDTIQAGVSLTMTVNLEFAHTAAQADAVAETAPYTCSHLLLYMKKSGTVTPTVRIEKEISTTVGSPSGSLAHSYATDTIGNADVLTEYSWVRADFTSFTIYKTRPYWIVVYDDTSRTSGNRLYWAGDGAMANPNTSVTKTKTGTDAWADELVNDMYFRINSGQGLDDECAFLFEYKRQLYAIAQALEGTAAASLWMNGDRGRATSGGSLTLTDTSKSGVWTANQWAGCIILIIGGTGEEQYRTVASNTTGGVLTVTDAWTVNPDVSSEYVILGSNVWTNVTPVTGDTIDGHVTDALVANDILYLAFGEAHYLWRYIERTATTTVDATSTNGQAKLYVTATTGFTAGDIVKVNYGGTKSETLTVQSVTAGDYLTMTTNLTYAHTAAEAHTVSGGSWTKSSADDGTGHADLLMEHKQNIYRARLTNQVSKAPVVAWGTNLTFGTADMVGTTDYDITDFSVYDSEVYAGKEDSLWVYRSGAWEKLPINTEPMASGDNFRNMVWHNAYLFFPFGHSLERMYGLQIDDMGPNREEGLPQDYQGPISDLIPLPGTLYASIDAGATGTSSILAYNDLGWHSVLVGTDGDRIRCMHMQVIPDGPNRLWYGRGNDVNYCLIPARAFNPLKDSTYRYTPSGTITTSWVDLGLASVTKYFKELKVVADRLTPTVFIRASYQLDNSKDISYATHVNGDSLLDQPILKVLSTTNFCIGDIVSIAADTSEAEIRTIASKTASTLTLTENLTYTHSNTEAHEVVTSPWILIGDYTTSPYQERSIGTFITGKRIRFKLQLTTNDSTTTPVLLAYTVDALARIPPKDKWEIKISLRDYPELLDGSIDPDSRVDKITQLDTWADSAEPLYFTTCDPSMSDKVVLVEPVIELDKKLEPDANGTGRIVANEGRLILLEA